MPSTQTQPQTQTSTRTITIRHIELGLGLGLRWGQISPVFKVNPKRNSLDFRRSAPRGALHQLVGPLLLCSSDAAVPIHRRAWTVGLRHHLPALLLLLSLGRRSLHYYSTALRNQALLALRSDTANHHHHLYSAVHLRHCRPVCKHLFPAPLLLCSTAAGDGQRPTSFGHHLFRHIELPPRRVD